MNINQRNAIIGFLILILSMAISSCGAEQFFAPASTPLPADTLTPTNTFTPTLTPTPFPVNAELIGDSITITPKNANFIQRLADLWPSKKLVSSAVFYNESLIALGTGRSSKSGNFSGLNIFEITERAKITLWDIRTNTELEISSTNALDTRYSIVTVSPNQKWIAFAANDRFMLGELQNNADGELKFKSAEIDISEIEEDGSVIGAAFSHDSRLLAIVGQFGGIMIWDVEANQKMAALPVTFIDEEFPISNCMFSFFGTAFSLGDKSILSSCGSDVLIRDVNLTEQSTLLSLMSPAVFALSPDGNLLVTGSYGGETSFWQLSSGQSSGMFSRLEHTTEIANLAFSPDGSLLASVDTNGTVILWDVQDGTNLAILDTSARFAVFSPDNKFLLVEGLKGGGSLWGIRSDSLQAERSGIKVVLSEGSVYLAPWEDVVPNDWLASQGAFPRYEIRISSSWDQLGSCAYGQNPIRSVSRRRSMVKVQIVDLETNTIIDENVFNGSIPDQCPDSWKFSQFSFNDYLDGADPEIEAFEPWLKETMSEIGINE